jgi:Fe-S oxidoreductase/nitrate reductase gamma subunit
MYSISAINYVFLAVLLTASLVSLGFGLRKYWQRIRQGQAWFGKEITREAVLAKVNWKTFVRRGLLLERLKKRPISGIAHNLLFFGAIIEIVGHGAYGLSFIGIDVYNSGFGRYFMELGREIGGLMILAGILFFTLRRLAPPARLTAGGHTRKGFSPMEALLLATVLLGFIAEGFRLTNPEAHSQFEFVGNFIAGLLAGGEPQTLATGNLALWWLHMLFGCAFIALIGHTPMSHMVLGLTNSGLANKRSGINLAPIDFDAEAEAGKEEPELLLGANKVSQLSQKYLMDAATCLWCGRCHEVCPAAQTGKALSPKTIMATVAEYMAQDKFDDESLIETIGKEAVFNCTTCAACIEECPVSNAPAEIVLELRRNFVMEQSDMPDTMAASNANMEKRGHPFVGTSANVDDWKQGLPFEVPIFEPGKTEYLFWLGCAVTYEERAQNIARAMAQLLEAAGISWGIMEGPHCTGDVSKMMGNEMQYVETAQANIEEMQELQVNKVLTTCAHCYNNFSRYYPELGGTWETIHHSVFIDQLIKDGKLKVRQDDEKITFHDPCYLARHNDIVDETRNVVSSVGKLVEMPRHGKNSFCCGAGGGNYWGGQGGTARINDVRAEEAFATGADKIATSCPFCNLMLTSSAAKHTEERKVFDIAELVLDKLENRPAAWAQATN